MLCTKRSKGGFLRAGSPQHIRHNEESHMASADVHLVQMADSAVARCHSYVFELHIHVVFGCKARISIHGLRKH